VALKGLISRFLVQTEILVKHTTEKNRMSLTSIGPPRRGLFTSRKLNQDTGNSKRTRAQGRKKNRSLNLSLGVLIGRKGEKKEPRLKYVLWNHAPQPIVHLKAIKKKRWGGSLWPGGTTPKQGERFVARRAPTDQEGMEKSDLRPEVLTQRGEKVVSLKKSMPSELKRVY